MKLKTVAIDRIRNKQTTTLLMDRMNSLLEEVRVRAYELFDWRGREDGHDLEDWFQAEHELGMLPVARIDETETEVGIRIELSGFSPERIKVQAEPQAITVEGVMVQEADSDDRKQTNVAQRAIFGRYELPAAIDTHLVTAMLQNGVLEIVAKKVGLPVEVASVKDEARTQPPTAKKEMDRSAAA